MRSNRSFYLARDLLFPYPLHLPLQLLPPPPPPNAPPGRRCRSSRRPPNAAPAAPPPRPATRRPPPPTRPPPPPPDALPPPLPYDAVAHLLSLAAPRPPTRFPLRPRPWLGGGGCGGRRVVGETLSGAAAFISNVLDAASPRDEEQEAAEERVRADECRAEVSIGRGNQHEVATFPNAVMAWCGYLIIAVAATGSCYGLAGTPGAALVAYALLLLGVTSIWRAMLPPRPREDGNRGVGKGNRQWHEVAVLGAWTMAWCGCLLMAVPVLASSAGFIDGLGTTFFAYTLQLLGVAIIIAAMLLLALAKLKIA